MTTKKVLGLIIFLLGAGTLAYLALFKVGSGVFGVGGGIAAIVGYALLFGFSTGRKAIAGDGK
jgi:membrane-bound ClpP family serine protease